MVEASGSERIAAKVALGALVLGVLGCTPAVAGQEKKVPTYPVQSQLVQVFLTVSDGKDRITNLKESDFSVKEDGRVKDLYRLDNAKVPLQVALLLDTSSSMQEALPETQEAAVYFVESLEPRDRVTLIPFNSEIQSMPQFLDDSDPIKQAIRSTRARGATRLYDALLFAMKYLSDKDGRKAIVVFSDGEDTGRNSSLNLVLNAAARCGYPIYAIGAGAALRGDHLKLVLRPLAEINSGRCYYVQDPGNLRDVFREVAEELRSAYILNYYTQVPQDGRWHDIEIELANPRHRAHSRRGFYARRGGSKAGATDTADVALQQVDLPAEWAAPDAAQAEAAARAAAAEIMAFPLPVRTLEPAAIGTAPPQSRMPGPAEPLFRVETRFIEVPALVESADGRELPPLRVKDFRVYEDGSPREIAYFNSDLTKADISRIREMARRNVEARSPTRPLSPSSALGEEGVLGKVFLLLDDLLTAPPSFLVVKKAAGKIIRENHTPLRPLSLYFTSESETDAASSAGPERLLAKLSRAVSRPNNDLTSNDNIMSVYEAHLIDRGEQEATQLAELRLASSLQVSYSNALGSVSGPFIISPEEIQTQVATMSRMLVLNNESQVERLLDGLRATIGAAMTDPGDYAKTVILISSGFVLGHGNLRPRLQEVIDSARRQGIRVFTIEATGLAGREGIGIGASSVFLVQNPHLERILRVHESDWIFQRGSSLSQLARGTGGEFIHDTNDLAAAAGQVVRVVGRLYYLGYLSDQPSDGRFHQIRVAAAAPGVRVHARSGYFAEQRDGEKPIAQSELSAEDWQVLLARVKQSQAAGDIAGMITSLEKLVRMFPRSVPLWYNLGASHLQTGNYSQAVRAFQKALGLAPDDTGIGTLLARAFVAAGSHDAAAQTIVLMIQHHPGDARLLFQLGRIYEAAARTAEAYQVYRQTLDRGFDVPLDLYLALTRTAAALGRKVEAGIFSRDYLAHGGFALLLTPVFR